MLRETLTLTGAQLRKDGIELVAEVPETLPPIECVAQEIQQVFLNLLNNSRYALNEASERDGRPPFQPKITITADTETVDGTPFVRLSFRDNGTGIPEDVLDKITNPFFTTKPRGKGTGLGLSISHGIVTDHGGRLVVESTEGESTRVSILLPTERQWTVAPGVGTELPPAATEGVS